MYISRIELNPRSREARRDVASAYDMHRTIITHGFPGSAASGNRILFRLDTAREQGRTAMILLVQSSGAEPDWSLLPAGYSLGIAGPKHFAPAVRTGEQFSFRLLANPITRSRTGERSEGVRGHARFHRRGLLDEIEQQGWLNRKGEAGGFRPLFTTITPAPGPRTRPSNVTHERKETIPHAGVRYDGVLQITDPTAFIETLRAGIGPAKAFGFGLLSIARLPG